MTILKDKNQKKNTISEGNIENNSFSFHTTKDSNINQKFDCFQEKPAVRTNQKEYKEKFPLIKKNYDNQNHLREFIMIQPTQKKEFNKRDSSRTSTYCGGEKLMTLS